MLRTLLEVQKLDFSKWETILTMGYFDPPNLMDYYNHLIELEASKVLTDLVVLEKELVEWKLSKKRQEQIIGDKYYSGVHDILKRKRTAIGEDGELVCVENLPNNRIIDNQYGKLVDQKANYLIGNPIVFETKDEAYMKHLNKIFSTDFNRVIKTLCVDCLNCGIAWLYVYYDENGKFKFKRFAPYEVLPIWQDEEHNILECLLRCYNVYSYENGQKKLTEKVELYGENGIEYYNYFNGRLVPDVTKENAPYFRINGKEYNWDQIPIIAFKYNFNEIPLIRGIKSLQDAINDTLSDYQNNMQEDARNTILILRNYDGENLGEFRHNLSTYGVVKVRDDGDVKPLKIEVAADNYGKFIELKKQELICTGKGYDINAIKTGGRPNEMNIKAVFNDIHMDSNSMELEFKYSLEQLLHFVNAHLANIGAGNFFDKEVDIIFNKDQIVNESDVIGDIKTSLGIISLDTLMKNHPYTRNVDDEKRKLIQERAAGLGFNPLATYNHVENIAAHNENKSLGDDSPNGTL